MQTVAVRGNHSKRGLDRDSSLDSIINDLCIICFSDCSQIRPNVKDFIRGTNLLSINLHRQLLNFRGNCCSINCWLKFVAMAIGDGPAAALRRRIEAHMGCKLLDATHGIKSTQDSASVGDTLRPYSEPEHKRKPLTKPTFMDQ